MSTHEINNIFLRFKKKKNFSSRLPLSKDGFFFLPIKKREKKNLTNFNILNREKKEKKKNNIHNLVFIILLSVFDALNLLIMEYCGMSFCIVESMF